MSDHTAFGDTQEEQAQAQMVEYGVRMRKERDTYRTALLKLVTAYDDCFDPDAEPGTADRLGGALDVAHDLLGIEAPS